MPWFRWTYMINLRAPWWKTGEKWFPVFWRTQTLPLGMCDKYNLYGRFLFPYNLSLFVLILLPWNSRHIWCCSVTIGVVPYIINLLDNCCPTLPVNKCELKDQWGERLSCLTSHIVHKKNLLCVKTAFTAGADKLHAHTDDVLNRCFSNPI